jgi:acetoin utilization deacetylase AcuC-like enzyme
MIDEQMINLKLILCIFASVIKIAFHPYFMHPVATGHRFPMEKYELIPEQLLYEGCITPQHLFEPSICDEATVLLTHDLDYLNKLKNLALSTKEERAIGFIQNKQLIERELLIMGGTLQAAIFALEHGCALNIAGGTHHAFTNRGEGFCLLNDFAIASNYLLNRKLANKILIVDLDVHQGNGTAAIFANNENVITFSMHGAHNYPFHKEVSDYDIGLPDKIEDDDYLKLLSNKLDEIFLTHAIDFVCYQSGVDILSTDKFGKLNITMEGCKARDEMVLSRVYQKNIPIVLAMGGGYSPQISTIVTAHCNTFKVALSLWDN